MRLPYLQTLLGARMTLSRDQEIEEVHNRIAHTWALYVQTKRTLKAIERIIEGIPKISDSSFDGFFSEMLDDEGSLLYLRLSALFEAGRSPTHSVPHLLAFLEQQRVESETKQTTLMRSMHLDAVVELGRTPWERLSLYALRFSDGEHGETLAAAKTVRDTTVAHAHRTTVQSRLNASINQQAVRALLEDVRRFVLLAGVTYLPKAADPAGEFGAITNPDRTDITRLINALAEMEEIRRSQTTE